MGCFYQDGLQFECTGCHYCCSTEPGFVFLSKNDANALARATGLSLEQFIDVYCRKVDMGAFKLVSLKEKENFDCIFLTKQGCSVYADRPRQCRTYPFWANVMEDRESWEREGQGCPGIGKGRRYSKEEIDQLIQERAGQEPMMLD